MRISIHSLVCVVVFAMIFGISVSESSAQTVYRNDLHRHRPLSPVPPIWELYGVNPYGHEYARPSHSRPGFGQYHGLHSVTPASPHWNSPAPSPLLPPVVQPNYSYPITDHISGMGQSFPPHPVLPAMPMNPLGSTIIGEVQQDVQPPMIAPQNSQGIILDAPNHQLTPIDPPANVVPLATMAPPATDLLNAPPESSPQTPAQKSLSDPDLNEAQSSILEREQDCEQLKKEMRAANQKMEQLRSQIAQLREKASNSQRRAKAAESKMLQLEKELGVVKSKSRSQKNEKKDKKVELIEGKLSELEGELENARRRSEIAQKEAARVMRLAEDQQGKNKKRLAMAKEQIARFEAIQKAAKNKLAETRRTMADDYQAEVEKSRKQIRELRDQVSKLQQNNVNGKSELLDTKEKLAQQILMNRELEVRLKNMEATLQKRAKEAARKQAESKRANEVERREIARKKREAAMKKKAAAERKKEAAKKEAQLMLLEKRAAEIAAAKKAEALKKAEAVKKAEAMKKAEAKNRAEAKKKAEAKNRAEAKKKAEKKKAEKKKGSKSINNPREEIKRLEEERGKQIQTIEARITKRYQKRIDALDTNSRSYEARKKELQKLRDRQINTSADKIRKRFQKKIDILRRMRDAKMAY